MLVKKKIIYSSIFLIILLLLIIKPLSAAPSNNPIFATAEWVEQKIQQLLNTFNQHEQQNQTDFDFINSRADALEERIGYLESLLTLTPTPTPASVVLLEDNFDGPTLNTQIWEVFQNNGRYGFENGFLIIDGGPLPGMPFFRSKENPFLSSNSFEVEFGIQYLEVYPAGIGLSFSIIQQVNITPGWENNPVSYWQDNGGDGLRFLKYGNLGTKIGSNDKNYHVVKVIYDGDKYLGYVDSTHFYISPSLPKAGGIWFGHPYYSDLPGWTSFKIDYIKVRLL